MNLSVMPSQPLRLYRMPISGHCHRVQLMLALLGLPYETVDVDLLNGEQRKPEFLAMNPFGQVPVLEDGGQVLSDSNAILVYLAQRYAPQSHWIPAGAVAQARMQRWFSLAAWHLDEGPATARFSALIGREVTPHSQAIGHRLFAFMEAELAGRSWLVREGGDAPTLADISLYSYSSQAPIGGISLSDYPHVRQWLARVEALPGFIPLTSELRVRTS